MSMNHQLLSFKSTHLLLLILVSIALFACVPGGACGGITRPEGWSSGVVQDSVLYMTVIYTQYLNQMAVYGSNRSQLVKTKIVWLAEWSMVRGYC
jgi:hypothetical protein